MRAPLQQIGAIGHGLHAAGDDDFGFAELHGLRGESHGFQSRAADFVDGHGGDAGIESAAQRGLTRGILAEAGLDDVAHDDFVDRMRVRCRRGGRLRRRLWRRVRWRKEARGRP